MKRIITAITSAALLAATCLTFGSCNAGNVKKTGDALPEILQTSELNDSKYTDVFTLTMPDIGMVSICSLSETVTDDSVTKVIKATVLPDSQADKSTVWSAHWITPPAGEDVPVTDYVTVTPVFSESNLGVQGGSNYCAVTCIKAFPGAEIGITVTTVSGGATAECKATYTGVPTAIVLHEMIDMEQYNDACVTDDPVITINAGMAYKLIADNVFHAVGNEFGTYEVIAQGCTGQIAVSDFTNIAGEESTVEKIVDLSDYYDRIITVEILGDVIVVSPAFENPLLFEMDDNTGNVHVIEYVSGFDNCTFYVTVRDTVSGISRTLNYTITM